MPVVQVGVVRVAMRQRVVLVLVFVGFPGWIAFVVRMLVMLIVHVAMGMPQRLVRMLVFVPLGKVQPHARRHQCPGHGKRRRDGLVQQGHAQDRADEGCRGEVCSGSGSP